MNEQETSIDGVLKAMGAVRPPAGLEQRVLAAMHQREEALAAAPARRWTLWVLAPVAATAVAAVVVLAVVHGGSRPAPAVTTAGRVDVVGPQSLGSNARPVVGAAPMAGRTRVVAARGGEEPAAAADVDPAYLPSMVAPPMPLTAEEKRLMRAARHEQTFDMAQAEPPQTRILQFAERLLGPLATANSLNPPPPAAAEPASSSPAESESNPVSSPTTPQ